MEGWEEGTQTRKKRKETEEGDVKKTRIERQGGTETINKSKLVKKVVLKKLK